MTIHISDTVLWIVTVFLKQTLHANKLSILGGFFLNNDGCQNNHFPRVKTKQNGMKKAKCLYSMSWKEFVLKNENQETYPT